MMLKTLQALLLPAFSLALAASAHGQAEWKTFTSADGERSFVGQLQAYDDQTNTVTMLNRQRQTVDFDIELLSDEDREYVVTTAPTLPVRAFLEVTFQPMQERQSSDRSGTTRRTESDGGFQITIDNFLPVAYRDVTVEYLMIYRKDSASGGGTDQVLRGTRQIDLEANGTLEIETESVQLVSSQSRPRAVG